VTGRLTGQRRVVANPADRSLTLKNGQRFETTALPVDARVPTAWAAHGSTDTGFSADGGLTQSVRSHRAGDIRSTPATARPLCGWVEIQNQPSLPLRFGTASARTCTRCGKPASGHAIQFAVHHHSQSHHELETAAHGRDTSERFGEPDHYPLNAATSAKSNLRGLSAGGGAISANRTTFEEEH